MPRSDIRNVLGRRGPESSHLEEELARTRASLHALEASSSAAIRELQEWNTNQAREIDELRERLSGVDTDRALLLSVAALAERHRRVAASPADDGEADDLTAYELRAFSQNGEDGVIAEILRRIGTPRRSFVEFGVQTGREGNCVFLADVVDYRGLFVEADAGDFAALEAKYASRPRVDTRRGFITPENVEETFAEAGVDAEPAVVSIDVDGSDYWIWEALASHRPRVVVIEYNSALPPDRRLVQPREVTAGWDGTEFFGASLGAVRALGESKRYRLVYVGKAALNAFFVREDLAAGRFSEPGDVALRGGPNYFHAGYRHPADERGRRYLDLDTGDLVTVPVR